MLARSTESEQHEFTCGTGGVSVVAQMVVTLRLRRRSFEEDITHSTCGSYKKPNRLINDCEGVRGMVV